MADLSIRSDDASLRTWHLRVIDTEDKIPRALVVLGASPGTQVALLDPDGGFRAAQLEAAGAVVTRVPGSAIATPGGTVFGALVGCWLEFPVLPDERASWLASADAALDPDGRVLLIQDYGRDDVSRLFADPDRDRELLAWSHRDGWFLRHGFRVRVLHCWWTWATQEEARADLVDAFGSAARPVIETMRRPRLEYKVAVYHRTVGDGVRPGGG